MKDNFLLKSKKIIDHIAVIGVFYILVYQIKALKEIGKGVCQYLINWFLDTDMVTLKRLYIVGEQIFRIFIVIAVVLSIIMKIVQCVHERKLKNIKGENRFEKSLLKYLHDRSI